MFGSYGAAESSLRSVRGAGNHLLMVGRGLLGLLDAAQFGDGCGGPLAASQDRRMRSRSTPRSHPTCADVLGGTLVPHPAGEAFAQTQFHAGDDPYADHKRSYRGQEGGQETS